MKNVITGGWEWFAQVFTDESRARMRGEESMSAWKAWFAMNDGDV